jgi:hypothetical protein
VIKWTHTAAKQSRWYRAPHKYTDCTWEKITGDPQLLRAVTVPAENTKTLISFSIPS